MKLLDILVIIFIIVASGFVCSADADQIKVAVIDTGYNIQNKQHDKVPLCKIGHYDFRSNKPVIGRDLIGHGTSMINTIVSKAGDSTKYCIMVLNIHKFAGFESDTISRAVVKAVKSGASIINMSLEGPIYNYKEKRAIKWASYKRVVIFVAAGNRRLNLNYQCSAYPACYRGIKNMKVIGAVDGWGQKASYSNYGSFLMWYPGNALGLNGTSVSTALATGNYVNWLLKKRGK